MPNTMIPGGIIDDLRRLENSALPDSAVILRNGQVTPCRVTDTPGKESIEGLPHFMELRIWQLTFTEGTLVRQGDLVTVTSPTGVVRGTYLVTLISFTASFSAANVAFAILLYDGAGGLVLLTNYAGATFTSDRTNETLVTDVFAWQPDHPMVVAENVPLFGWSVLFDNRLRYTSRTPPSNSAIGASDGIHLPFMGTTGPGTLKSAAISKPYPHVLIPQVSIAHFNDKP